MTETCDAVVVGSGVNGLVAADRLADACWSRLRVVRRARDAGAHAQQDV